MTIAAREDDLKRKDARRVVERCEVINQKGEVVLKADHILICERRVKQV